MTHTWRHNACFHHNTHSTSWRISSYLPMVKNPSIIISWLQIRIPRSGSEVMIRIILEEVRCAGITLFVLKNQVNLSNSFGFWVFRQNTHTEKQTYITFTLLSESSSNYGQKKPCWCNCFSIVTSCVVRLVVDLSICYDATELYMSVSTWCPCCISSDIPRFLSVGNSLSASFLLGSHVHGPYTIYCSFWS